MDNFLDNEPDNPPPIKLKPRNVVKRDTAINIYAHELYYNNGKNGPVQQIMMKLGCAALTDPKFCPYFEHTLMAVIWSNTYVKSEELQERGQSAQQLWFPDLMAMTLNFPEGADKDVRKWYLPSAPGFISPFLLILSLLIIYFYYTGKPVVLWCVANQDKDHQFSMHHELIQQTHDIEGSLDYHVFGGANSTSSAPIEGRVVHVHHDMIWLNDAQFKAMKYVAQHYFIHPRPGHPLVSNASVVADIGPTEEELINFILLPTVFEKATTDQEPAPYVLNHDALCVCALCKPVLVTAVLEEESPAVESEVTVDGPQVEVVSKKGGKRHFVDEN